MIRIGITGQTGFIGTHLFNHLGLDKNVERIPFRDEFFINTDSICGFVKKCDVIVHLAAVNRHSDMQVLYDTNILLVKKLISAMEAEYVNPHVLFSSSSQEDSDNKYGASKIEGRRLFEEWSFKSGAKFTGFIIPNVFGPFGLPNYNSVVATFCHKITHGADPEIYEDRNINLIYVNDLCNEIIRVIRESVSKNPYVVPYGVSLKVTKILEKLKYFKITYFDHQELPYLENDFEKDLFNTFISYIEHRVFYPKKLESHIDNRGSFVEVIKLHENGGQVSFSTTKPGVTRGNHFHTRKFERFTLIKGKAKIQLRRIGTEEILDFEIDGSDPAFVDMPIWFTHNITNIGKDDIYTLFWISECFDSLDPDTFYEKV